MRQSGRRTYQSKGIGAERNGEYGEYRREKVVNSEYQFRTSKSKNMLQTSKINVGSQSILNYQVVDKPFPYNPSIDFQHLLGHRNILLDLISQFQGRDKVIIQGSQRDDFNKRLILLQGQIQGLLRRKITLQEADQKGERRQLDYGVILNEKQNRIIELEGKIKNLQDKLSLVGHIYQQQLSKLKAQNPGLNIQVDDLIFSVLKNHNTSVSRQGDAIHIQQAIQKTIEVPVQDAQTKQLIQLLTSTYKRLFTKYPKLYDELDPRLAQFFSQQLIDTIQTDSLDRLVQVVKYVPQVVKVQNIYAYSSQKSRKLEFYLRVLIKALLEEMEKMRVRCGGVMEMDEGVIGLMREEIMDVAGVEDILKVYRGRERVVEVEKVVEKVVQKIVQVPKIVQVQRIVETPVEVKKYSVVENTVTIPLQVPRLQTLIVEKLVQVPRIQQKIVQVPKIIQKIVQVIKQVPRVIEVQKIVEKPVQVEKYRQIEKEIVVPIMEYRDVELVREKIVPMKEIVEKSVPVEQIVEKIVEVRVEVPKVVQVEKVIQKIVQRVEYIPAPDIRNHIEIRYQPIDRIIQKPIPIIQTVQQIIQVPQIVQKIIQVHNIIEKPIQVEVVVEKPVYRDRIKEVERVVERPVVEYRTVEKVVEKVVQVPLVKEVVKVEREFVQKPVVEIIEKLIHKQVQIEKPKILYQDRLKEVEKIVNHFIKEPQIIRIIEDRIVPVEKVVERVKPVPTIIEKVIEKLVEVPKVVEVEKIVQKVVVVPRVVEKVVEVPQIVEKIVQKIVTIPQIVQIEKIVNIPVIQQRVIEVEAPKNIYLTIQKPVDVVREVLVRDQIYKQNTKFQQLIAQRVVVQNIEIPRTLEVQKIVTNIIQQPKIIEINRDIIIPVEIQVPIDRLIEKIVPIQVVHREIQQIDKFRDRIIPLKQQQIKVVEVQKKVDNVIMEQKIKQVQRIVPYFQDRVVEVEKLREKIIPVQRVIQQIKQVSQIVQKVVDRVRQIPKVYQIQKLVQKRINQPKIIQVQRMVPQIINVNRYIENIVQKIIEVPVLVQQLREIEVEKEKIVQVRTEQIGIKQVDRMIEKEVVVERLKQVTNNIHLIESTLQIVERIIQKNLEPVLVTQEKVMEVPQIVEKIVEKIVVMPQIVQVLKYVHEIAEKQSLGVAVSDDIGMQEKKYKDLASGLKSQLESLIMQLSRTKSSNPSVRNQIQSIQQFLAEYETFLVYPRIQQIIKKQQVEKVIQKERPILVQVESEANLRQQLAKTVLIERLISQLKSLKHSNPTLTFSNLDDDINLIFFSQMGDGSKFSKQKFQSQLNEFSNSVQRKFIEMGGWSAQHQFMLNSFLQQRFMMASVVKNSNEIVRKTKAISQKRLEELRRLKEENETMAVALRRLEQILPSEKDTNSSRTMQSVQMAIRQKDALIHSLKSQLLATTQSSQHQSSHYTSQLNQLTIQKTHLETLHSKCADQKQRYVQQIQLLKSKISELEVQIQRVRMLSPKESINTMNSITSPLFSKRLEKRVEVSEARQSEKSETDSEGYGRSYRNYRNYEEGNHNHNNNKDVDQQQNTTYKSPITNRTKKLLLGSELAANSANGTLLGSKVSSQNYIVGSLSSQYRSNELLESTSVNNRIKMSTLSGGTSIAHRNYIKANGKKTYYEGKYQG